MERSFLDALFRSLFVVALLANNALARAQTVDSNIASQSMSSHFKVVCELSHAGKTEGPQLILRRTEKILPKTHDLLWDLIVTGSDGKQQSFRALTGRSFSQQRDRYRSGREAPLPMGVYNLGAASLVDEAIKRKKPEFGDGYYISLNPVSQGRSTRSHLAIHVEKVLASPMANLEPRVVLALIA